MSDTLPKIPGYKIEKQLGHGGMAVVYLGEHEVLGRKVAIKVLNRHMSRNSRVVQRFLNEARTASRLEHPNIVTIHDVGQVGDICYIVMECLRESLVDRIERNPNQMIPPREAFRILRRMAMALDYAHREGFIHRDIKPDNILFRKDDEPVLVDFGIARAVDADSNLTTTGMIIGTPHYMSPEQCRGERIDKQSDIYSLGIVLYEMLTGDIPFNADSAAGILVKHIKEPLPKLPPELGKYQALLNKMVAKNKSQRVQGAVQLLQHVENLPNQSQIDTIEVAQPEKWVFNKGESYVEETTLTPYKNYKKKNSMFWILLILLFLVMGGAAYYYLYHQPNLQNKITNHQEQIQEGKEVLVNEPEIAHQDKKETDKPINQNMQKNDENAQYQKLLTQANQYIEKGNIKKAKETIKEAKKINPNVELTALEKKISERLEQEKLKEFNTYFSSATQYYKSGNYRKAKEAVKKASKILKNAELESLAVKINQKEKETQRKAQQAQIKKKNDDHAFQRAISSNTPFAYEKYLEKFPSGHHVKEAKKRMEELKNSIQLENKIQDDVAYEIAASTNTIDSYEKYLESFPLGLHLEKAKSKIQQLKISILKETKIKIELQNIKFFESSAKAQSMGKRSYNNRFSQSETRYIFTEIKYKNKMYGISNCSNLIRLEYKGDEDFGKIQLKGMIKPLQEAKDGIYWRGMGWADSGKWPKGTYTVTVYIEDQKIDQSQFTIY